MQITAALVIAPHTHQTSQNKNTVTPLNAAEVGGVLDLHILLMRM